MAALLNYCGVLKYLLQHLDWQNKMLKEDIKKHVQYNESTKEMAA
jgi:hypothetical protein